MKISKKNKKPSFRDRISQEDPSLRASEIKARLIAKYGNKLEGYTRANPCAVIRLVNKDPDTSKLCPSFLQRAECASYCKRHALEEDLPLLRK